MPELSVAGWAGAGLSVPDLTVPELTLWVSVAVILYSSLGYPAILWLLTVWRRRERYAEPLQPTLSMIVTAYNEEAVLSDKVANTFSLDYPEDKVQLVVISDGSTDATDEVAAACERPGFLYLRQERNAGKTTAQNVGVRAASGQVLVFSDANSMYEPQAFARLLAPFADPRVGCVCGELRYVNPSHAGAGKGETRYWSYEQFLKRRESQLGSLVGANGAIYAMRRELFEELDGDIVGDLIMPVRVRLRGHRVVYEPDAVAVEESGETFLAELKRRRRIVGGSIYSLLREPGALNPFRHPLFAFQLLSHKVLRWLMPVLMLLVLVASGVLALQGRAPYDVLFAAQGAFYGLALLGTAVPRGLLGGLGLFYLPAYLCAINLGALLGIWDALRGQRHTVWTPVARPE